MYNYYIDIRFVLFFLFTTSFKDIWTMAKSELPYWFYDDDPTTIPHINEKASDAASISQFALMYFYALSAAFVLYNLGNYSWQTVVGSLGALLWLHWTGTEDLGYYIFQRWIKFPKEYLDTHKFINILGWQIPINQSWLSRSRKVWFVNIPSIMGWVLGKDVPVKKFLIFVLLNIVLIVGLSFIKI